MSFNVNTFSSEVRQSLSAQANDITRDKEWLAKEFQGETYFRYSVTDDTFIYVSNNNTFLPVAGKFESTSILGAEFFPFEHLAVVENEGTYNGQIDIGEKIKFYTSTDQGEIVETEALYDGAALVFGDYQLEFAGEYSAVQLVEEVEAQYQGFLNQVETKITSDNKVIMQQPDLEEVLIESITSEDSLLPPAVVTLKGVKIKEGLTLDVTIYDHDGVLGETDGFSALMTTRMNRSYTSERFFKIKHGGALETEESVKMFEAETGLRVSTQFSEEDVSVIRQAYERYHRSQPIQLKVNDLWGKSLKVTVRKNAADPELANSDQITIKFNGNNHEFVVEQGQLVYANKDSLDLIKSNPNQDSALEKINRAFLIKN